MLEAARAALGSEKAAGRFVKLLEAHYGPRLKQSELEERISQYREKIPAELQDRLNPSWPRGDIAFTKSVPRRTPRALPPKDALVRLCQSLPIPRQLRLDAAAVLLRVSQGRGREASSVTWAELSRQEKSQGWKLVKRHLLGDYKASRLDVARRRELVGWIQLAVLALGGRLLTYSDSELAGGTWGVRLVSAAVRYLGMPEVTKRGLAREIKAVRRWAKKLPPQLRKPQRRRALLRALH